MKFSEYKIIFIQEQPNKTTTEAEQRRASIGKQDEKGIANSKEKPDIAREKSGVSDQDGDTKDESDESKPKSKYLNNKISLFSY